MNFLPKIRFYAYDKVGFPVITCLGYSCDINLVTCHTRCHIPYDRCNTSVNITDI